MKLQRLDDFPWLIVTPREPNTQRKRSCRGATDSKPVGRADAILPETQQLGRGDPLRRDPDQLFWTLNAIRAHLCSIDCPLGPSTLQRGEASSGPRTTGCAFLHKPCSTLVLKCPMISHVDSDERVG